MTRWTPTHYTLLIFPLVLGMGSAYLFGANGSNCQEKKPKLQPPPIVFIIIWPILYILLGLSITLYWQATQSSSQILIAPYIILTVALQTWWIVFSKTCKNTAAFATLLTITILFAIQAVCVYAKSPIAAACLAPLLCWLSFASYLTRASH